MGDKAFSSLLRGPGFALGTWTCTHAHVRPGPEQSCDQPVVNVVLEGLFLRHVGRRTLAADTTVALVAPAGEVWRSSHPPGTCGDRGVYVLLDPDLGPREADRVLPLSARDWHAWSLARRDLQLATALVAQVIDGSALPTREPTWVTQARRLLGSTVTASPPLSVLATELRVSPWHLCRTFRAYTGVTPRQYSERHRLAAVLGRLEAGAPDVAELALSHGFSSHSHLSARFRAAFGRPPRSARS